MNALPHTDLSVIDGNLNVTFLKLSYKRMLDRIPRRDLMAELEHARDLAVEFANLPGDSAAVAELQVREIAAELTRRERISSSGHRLAPKMPARDDDREERVAAVKEAWPIEKFVFDVLGAPIGSRQGNRIRCYCPFHQESTPSFTVFVKEDRAWCFGACNAGGDVIQLAGMRWGLERFYDKLEYLEGLAGISPKRLDV